MSSWVRKVCTPLIAFAAYVLLRALHSTLRRQVRTPFSGQSDTPRVYVFWHGEQQLVLPFRQEVGPLAVLTSASADGRLQAKILRRFGMAPVMGSSSRRAASGLLGLVRKVKAGSHAGIAVDGPRGPRCRAKPGALQLARLTGAEIVPVRARVSQHWRFPRAWDQFIVPKPFARVELEVLAPLRVPKKTTREELEEQAALLTDRLNGGCIETLTPPCVKSTCVGECDVVQNHREMAEARRLGSPDKAL